MFGLKNKKLVLLSIGILIAAFAFLIGGAYYYFSYSFAYTIPGIPYFGIYDIPSHEHMYGDVAAIIYEVTAYWHNLDNSLPAFGYVELDKQFPGYRESGWSFKDLENFFKEQGYITEYHHISSLKDFKKFINPRQRTPLIIYQILEEGTRFTENFKPFRLIMGISFLEKKLMVYDFYLGANYEMSFDRFKYLWSWDESKADKDPRGFLAVYPQNYKELINKAEQINLNPAKRTNEMQLTAPLIIRYFQAKTVDIPYNYTANPSEVFSTPQGEVIIQKWESLANDSNFGLLMPFFRSFVYNGLSRDYLIKGDLQKAKETGEKAVTISKELKSDINCGWLPGGKGNIIAYIWKQLADVYLEVNDREKAISAYREALKIEPANEILNKEINDIISEIK